MSKFFLQRSSMVPPLQRQNSAPILNKLSSDELSRKQPREDAKPGLDHTGMASIDQMNSRWRDASQNSLRTTANAAGSFATIEDSTSNPYPEIEAGNESSILQNSAEQRVLDRERYQKQRPLAERLLIKFGLPTTKSLIGMAVLSKILKEIHPGKCDPMPKDVKWAFNLINVWKDGMIGYQELAVAIAEFDKYLRDQATLRQIIRDRDNNHDGILDSSELIALLQEATGEGEISIRDAEQVLETVKRIGNERFSGGYVSTMSANPDILSVAIVKWYSDTRWEPTKGHNLARSPTSPDGQAGKVPVFSLFQRDAHMQANLRSSFPRTVESPEKAQDWWVSFTEFAGSTFGGEDNCCTARYRD